MKAKTMNNDEDEVILVDIDGTQTSLADLAGIDLSDATEKRGMDGLPAGTYLFEVCLDQDGNGPGYRKLGDKAAAVFPCKVLDVIAIKDKADAPDGKPENLIGKVHRESLFMTNGDSLNYLAAFFADLGLGHKGKAKELFAASLGVKFQATIVVSKDKNDESRKYHNLNRNQGKIIPAVKKAA